MSALGSAVDRSLAVGLGGELLNAPGSKMFASLFRMPIESLMSIAPSRPSPWQRSGNPRPWSHGSVGGRVMYEWQHPLDAMIARYDRAVARCQSIAVLAVGIITCVSSLVTVGCATRYKANVDVRKFGVVGDGFADDTNNLKLALIAADGGAVTIPPGKYRVREIDIPVKKGLRVVATGAILWNTTQSPHSGRPILRLEGTPAADISIDGLQIRGPRPSSSTDLGQGIYGSAGYPSGIDITAGRTVMLSNISVTGTYYAGVEVHYCSRFIIKTSQISNHAYAGILFSDCRESEVVANSVDDIGAKMVGNGYGITASTSYDPTFRTGNGKVRIAENHVSRCKRKSIDVHNGLDVVVEQNFVSGFGYAAIEAVCEGPSKRVRDVIIRGNTIRGDTDFVSRASDAVISVGAYGDAVDQDTQFQISSNVLTDVDGPYGFVINTSTTSEKSTRLVRIAQNSIRNSDFWSLVGVNNYPSRVTRLEVQRNEAINVNCSRAVMFIQRVEEAHFDENSFSGHALEGYWRVSRDVSRISVSRNTLNERVVPP